MDNITQKVGASWDKKLYEAKIGPKQGKKGVFRQLGEEKKFEIVFFNVF